MISLELPAKSNGIINFLLLFFEGMKECCSWFVEFSNWYLCFFTELVDFLIGLLFGFDTFPDDRQSMSEDIDVFRNGLFFIGEKTNLAIDSF